MGVDSYGHPRRDGHNREAKKPSYDTLDNQRLFSRQYQYPTLLTWKVA